MAPGLSFPNYDIERQPNQATANHPQPVRLQLSPEEVRLLRECNRESFYYRSVPFAITGMLATYLAVKRGFLKSHPKWGSALKQTGAAFVGWFLGKLSYRTVCEEKFLHLRNSGIGDVIRKNRGVVMDTYDQESSFQSDGMINTSGTTPTADQDFHLSSGSLNLDTDKNVQYSGLDDRERPTTDSTLSDFNEDSSPLKPSTTYDELRFKSRARSDKQPQAKQDTSELPTRSWENYDYPARHDAEQSSPKSSFGDRWDR